MSHHKTTKDALLGNTKQLLLMHVVKEKLRSSTTHFTYVKMIREILMTYTEALHEHSIEDTIEQAVQFNPNVLLCSAVPTL